MRIITLLLISLFFVSCKTELLETKKDQVVSTEEIEKNINTSLDLWHKAAAEAWFFKPGFESKDGYIVITM